MNLFCLSLILYGIGAISVENPSFEACFPKEDVCALSGNGALTIGVSSDGRISQCRWPSPGASNQIDPLLSPENGLMWGIRTHHQTEWIQGKPWAITLRYPEPDSTIVETTATRPDTQITIQQTSFVHPTRDLLVTRLVVQNTEQPPIVYWYANFSPCTRVIPEWPIGDSLLSSLNDFAVATWDQGATIHHFRPPQPGREQWEKATRFIQAPTAESAHWFDDGIWISYTSPNGITHFQCGTEGDMTSAYTAASQGQLLHSTGKVGRCNSVIEMAPEKTENGYVAVVFTAFGKTAQVTHEILRFAKERGYQGAWEDTLQHWRQWLSSAILPNTGNEAIQTICKRDLLTIVQCMDRTTGGMIRCPSSLPTLGLDWPRHGAWLNWTLDLAGYLSLSEAHSAFYREGIRTKSERGKPYGSAPAAMYTNHQEACPSLILTPESAAWILGSYWRHISTLNSGAKITYLKDMNDAIHRAADFLVNWTDNRTRDPLRSFDFHSCFDMQTHELLLATYMGIESAIRLVEAIGQIPPLEWTRRKNDLAALIWLECVGRTGQWTSETIMPYWQHELAQIKGLPAWNDLIERRLNGLTDLSPLKSFETVCAAAINKKQTPDQLVSLRSFLQTISNALLASPSPTNPPDALKSALHFITAATIYAPPQ